MCQSLSCDRLFATPWTAAHQAPLSMGLSRQEYWSGLPFSSPKEAQQRTKKKLKNKKKFFKSIRDSESTSTSILKHVVPLTSDKASAHGCHWK